MVEQEDCLLLFSQGTSLFNYSNILVAVYKCTVGRYFSDYFTKG